MAKRVNPPGSVAGLVQVRANSLVFARVGGDGWYDSVVGPLAG